MQRLLFTAAFGVALLGLTGLGVGQVTNPFQPIEPVNPVNPAIQFPIVPEAGKSLILVHSFKGPKAAEQANELAAAVRRDHKLPAYVFAKGREERLKQQQHLEELRKKYGQSRFPIERIEEHYAVLVGGYKDAETARANLDSVRRLKPPEKYFISGERVQPGKSDKGEEGVFIQQIKINPFNSAFVVDNPTIPKDQRADSKKADPLMKKLNEDENYSLFQCKKPWTLVVAVFQGLPVVQAAGTSPSVMDKLLGRNAGEQLAASALNAHNLAEALRKLGFEAYVLHTRYNSVVTVGAYDTKDDRRMQQVQEALHNRFKLDGGMQFMAQPMPMEVPQS
ncbi:MAG: hypothetical protein JNM56_40385 [Planctomycetia bacterium]|nr:hypothetical protein [Planctomycetia bacterium]